MTTAQRAVALAAVTGRELNDELTILHNALDIVINDSHPLSREHAAALEARAAVQRIAWIAADLLRYAQQQGIRMMSSPGLTRGRQFGA